MTLPEHIAVAHRSEWGTLYRGDCRDVLTEIPADSCDLLLVDPPYGVGWQSNRGKNFDAIAGDGDTSVWAEAAPSALRALRRHRHAYVFGGLPVPEQLVGPADLVWDKAMTGLGNLALPWGPAHESIGFYVYESSKANRDGGLGRLAARLRQGSVIRCPRPNAAAVTRHPTEKPVPLLRQLIESSSCAGEIVLDPFAGAGSTGVAAVLSGRRYLMIELEERYAEIAASRLAEAEALMDKAARL